MTCGAEEVLITEQSIGINLHDLLRQWNQKKPSGAHSILTCVVEQQQRVQFKSSQAIGKINLVELANTDSEDAQINAL